MMDVLSAATVVPTNIEKLPLFHWRPGARLLAVGSRDGADFAADPAADRNTFCRPISPELLREAQAKQGLTGVVATWSASLTRPVGMACLREATVGALVVATAGVGDADLLESLLPVVDAWLLLVTAEVKPLDARILTAGRHVEVLVGLSAGAAVPMLPWSAAQAVHLTAVRPAEADLLDAWCETARAQLPAGVTVYDHHHPHTECRRCGERVIWRHSGRSRIDATRTAIGWTCTACGEPLPLPGAGTASA
jgi:predicted RNA-binding Zn-ribbon protein involved in translation (DUF1610 family)